jgi:hypothetical protein
VVYLIIFFEFRLTENSVLFFVIKNINFSYAFNIL